VLAGGDQLLGQQSAETGSGLDRPHPIRVERFGPREEPRSRTGTCPTC
jgi:hypothetical protein